MKKQSMVIVLAFLLGGCFSLKTPLPSVSLFDLDQKFPPHKSCKKSLKLGVSEIRSMSLYENPTMVLRKKNGEIETLQTQVWVDSPKNLFKKLLLKKFNAECIAVSIPPFGGVKNDLFLKVEIVNFDLLEGGGVSVGIFYELSSLKTFEVIKSEILSKREKGETIPAFQKAIDSILEVLSAEIKMVAK